MQPVHDEDYLLLSFKDDRADEIDIYGFALRRGKEWKAYCQRLQSEEIEWPYESACGSNQWLRYNSPTDYLNHIRVTVINSVEWHVLQKHFGTSYGEFIWVEG